MWATLYFNMWNVTSCIIEMLDDLPKLKNLKISSTWGELGLMTAGVYVQYGVAKVPKMERSYMQRVSIIYLFRMPVYKIRQPRGQCLFLRADMLPADPAGWLKIVNQLLPNNAIFLIFLISWDKCFTNTQISHTTAWVERIYEVYINDYSRGY